MGQAKLQSPAIVPPRVGDVVKGVANNIIKTRADNQPTGATESPLPVTPERLELIMAVAKRRERGTDEMATSRIAKRFAPRAPSIPLSRDYRGALAPLTSPVFALASRIRLLTTALIVAALLPNLTLAVFWFGLVNPPWSRVAAPPKESSHLALKPTMAQPVLSAPNILEASAGETVSLPIALDGTDGVPARSSIVIKGLPPGSALSEGYAKGETEWRLKPDQIGDLHLALPGSATGESKLSIELVTPDDRIIATAATTVEMRADATASLASDAVADAQVAGIEPEEPGPDESRQSAMVEATPAELVPLPDRRPAPPPSIDDASWIRPTAYVNLRQDPSSTATVVSVVAKGVKLRVTGRQRNWVQVSNPATSDSGWIYTGNVHALR
jgi:SH3 domain-containing protein